ncbi:SDR family NAD(P)-dependent oxidoreductase [Bacteroides fluxus]|uniref:SDR family NAD(P)-dependent oxidoreductase n=1 Tax=Bacteroides fluxus TaxID=626930 RepID=UPI0023F2EFF5|nr:SDR family oxidoreductase [Bacteroides fluxus]
MYNPFSLRGKTILVTGASSGIGRATAIECSRLGATVILTGRNEERLAETLNLLDISENKHFSIAADLTQQASIAELVSNLPQLDGCVNNAGIGKTTPVQFISENDLEHIFHLNCFAPILLTKELVRKKKLYNSSSLVFVLSIAGNFNILPGNSIYGSAKTGLSAFVKYAALELAGKGIRCNSVSPGMINTPFIQNQAYSEEDKQKDMSFYPLKRYGEPSEVAHAIIYLLSDAASWVTGTNLVIDGGRSLK